MKTEDFAAIIFRELSGLPVARRSNQLYIYLNLENPVTSKAGILYIIGSCQTK